ncbi:MAG TPA: glycine betaine ABC transporter substrate-binding protein [Clostridia bacterium]|nr:glycine betaine ABC transporter substrate-binding protein [Clostridia bacterium]
MESPVSQTNTDAKGEVTIGYVQWASAEASTHIVKNVLEEMDYQVNTPVLQTGAMYQATSTGEIDAFVCSWLPDTDRNYWQKYGDTLVELNNNYTSAQIGIVVPEYVDIDSLTEMKDYKEEFEGRIIGIDPGAAEMIVVKEDVMPNYELNDWALTESSGPAMTAELGRLIDEGKWVAVTGWKPHWKWSKWNLKFLKDPDLTMGDGEYIKTMGRPGIKEELPEVTAFLQNYTISTEQLGEVMLEIKNGTPADDAANDFVKNNPDLIDSWTSEIDN